jgi:hypothetical protein
MGPPMPKDEAGASGLLLTVEPLTPHASAWQMALRTRDGQPLRLPWTPDLASSLVEHLTEALSAWLSTTGTTDYALTVRTLPSSMQHGKH